MIAFAKMVELGKPLPVIKDAVIVEQGRIQALGSSSDGIDIHHHDYGQELPITSVVPAIIKKMSENIVKIYF